MKTTETTKTTKDQSKSISDPFSHTVIGCAIEVHRLLGPGLLESAYQQCLPHELALAHVPFKTQLPMPIAYKDVKLDCGYRLDFLIDDYLVIELEAVESIIGLHQAQLLTYMKLANLRLGLIINFNAVPLKNGIKRMAL